MDETLQNGVKKAFRNALRSEAQTVSVAKICHAARLVFAASNNAIGHCGVVHAEDAFHGVVDFGRALKNTISKYVAE